MDGSMSSSSARLVNEAHAVFEAADKQNRGLTADERVYVEDLLGRAEANRGLEERFKGFTGSNVIAVSKAPNATFGGAAAGPGDLFVKSSEYLRIKDPANRGDRWSTGPIQVSNIPLS
jgi:hypothetical protein